MIASTRKADGSLVLVFTRRLQDLPGPSAIFASSLANMTLAEPISMEEEEFHGKA